MLMWLAQAVLFLVRCAQARFDFSHGKAMTTEQLAEVEGLVQASADIEYTDQEYVDVE